MLLVNYFKKIFTCIDNFKFTHVRDFFRCLKFVKFRFSFCDLETGVHALFDKVDRQNVKFKQNRRISTEKKHQCVMES